MCQRICGHIDGFPLWRIHLHYNELAHQTRRNSRFACYTPTDSQYLVKQEDLLENWIKFGKLGHRVTPIGVKSALLKTIFCSHFSTYIVR